MAIIKGFRALRPNDQLEADFTTRSFDSYSEKEKHLLLKREAPSFLQLISPSFLSNSIGFKKKNKFIRENYQKFIAQNILIEEDHECLYVYKIDDKDLHCMGIIGLAHVQDYAENRIKKHENTLKKRVKLFAKYLKAVRYNAEPVLIAHEANTSLDNFYFEITKTQPQKDFTTDDGSRHRLWKIAEPNAILAISKKFESMSKVYIADGHHRSASSYYLYKNQLSDAVSETTHYFMAYWVPECCLNVHGFSRMVTDLNGLTNENFLEKIAQVFLVSKQTGVPKNPQKKHEWTMYLGGDFYTLSLKAGLASEKIPLASLDANILYEKVLHPILGIQNIRKDKRVHYISGPNQLLNTKTLVDSGKFVVGFVLYPTTFSEVKRIADRNEVMPPKSTYVTPKLRSGLTIYKI